MANLNKVMLIGRLTRDPESRTFGNGGKVTKFGFAVNNRRKNSQTGQWEDDPVFLDCEAFNRGEQGTLADRVEQTLRKGQQIFIEGHLRLDQWEDKETRQKRSRLLIVVDNFQYLEPKTDNGGSYEGSEASASRSTQRPVGARPPRQPAAATYAGDEDYPPSNGGEDDIPF